jgi:hypothetical protein
VYLNLRFVAKKLKESLIERARIKKSFAKALKKEGLQSERLGRDMVGMALREARHSILGVEGRAEQEEMLEVDLGEQGVDRGRA